MCADDSLPKNNPAVPSCGHSSKVSVPNPGTMTDGAALIATGARLDPDPAAEAHALGIGWLPDARLQSVDHEPVLVSAPGTLLRAKGAAVEAAARLSVVRTLGIAVTRPRCQTSG